MFKIVLWDIDGTLLDFIQSERHAVRECFERLGIAELSDAQIKRYSDINASYWRMLERGEVTKKELMRRRFEDFFAENGIVFEDIDALNNIYQVSLGEHVFFSANGRETVASLKGKVKQYAVTNGTAVAQRGKLKKSGLENLLDGVFISGEVGAEKPNKEFFDRVFEAIEPCPLGDILIVGDTLSSDILGGNNAGIKCCRYNPTRDTATQNLRVDYDIADLAEVVNIVENSVNT